MASCLEKHWYKVYRSFWLSSKIRFQSKIFDERKHLWFSDLFKAKKRKIVFEIGSLLLPVQVNWIWVRTALVGKVWKVRKPKMATFCSYNYSEQTRFGYCEMEILFIVRNILVLKNGVFCILISRKNCFQILYLKVFSCQW